MIYEIIALKHVMGQAWKTLAFYTIKSKFEYFYTVHYEFNI